MSLSRLFTPDIRVDKIEDIDLEYLKKDGYKAVILDIDNTLMPNKSPHPDQRCFDVIKWLQDAGFTVVISSNNKYSRVSEFCKDLGVKWYCWSCKPLPFIYNRIMKETGFKKEELITCGDQLLTDIFGSNSRGITSILVTPIKLDDDQWNTKIHRKVENFLFKHVVK